MSTHENDTQLDLLIIGGGINGTAIARDAAGRGLRVLLCEKDDLANHTSSSSTKLIHGGLRYLEYFEFRLVREALIEREALLRAAPHIIWPMRFILPYDKGLRPAWMLRLGLFLYDNMGGRDILPGTKTIKLGTAPHTDVLKSRLKKGFEYSDCWVEDARLVVMNALDAKHRGAEIRTRSEVVSLRTENGLYVAQVTNGMGVTETVHARGIINAAGPWVDEVFQKVQRGENDAGLRLIKGSHIITKRLFEGDHAFIFQNADERIIFAIPYEHDFTLIGTTDVPYAREDGPVEISDAEIKYLCDAASEYFTQAVTPKDVVWSYSGVRPLYDDKSDNASAVTRDYVLDIDEFEKGAPFLSVYGGKITTSRKLAEHALDKLSKYYSEMKHPWTETAIFPGGDIPKADFDAFFKTVTKRYPDLSPRVLMRLARAYGTRISLILGDGSHPVDLGREFGHGLTEAEVRYLVQHEWATSPEDILWRRSKLGLHMTKSEQSKFRTWFKATFKS